MSACVSIWLFPMLNVFFISVIYSESNAWKVEMGREREGWQEEKKRESEDDSKI